ncbi:spermatogenesis-associated protein 13 [Coemansia sp. RSA 1853]|nr:spermatogenesis-associated protein 13 [Coemansia sp. RSA 1853]
MLRPLEVLFTFQRRFLKSLCGRTSVAATAQLFLAEAHKFAVYIDYCGTYHWLCDLLERLKANSAWPNVEDEFQQKMAQYSDKRRLGLRDFLIKPVQRICKYPLFLKELLKYTDVRLESSTFGELNQALTSLKGICEGVDQVQQRIDSLRLRNTLLSSYCDCSELPLHFMVNVLQIMLQID